MLEGNRENAGLLDTVSCDEHSMMGKQQGSYGAHSNVA
jgi:hypothetical protein